LQGKDNFFEKKVSTYAKANVGSTLAEQEFDLEAAF
jgi:ribonucleotide reductase beta subunit family protein with ferritin-like domain